MTQYNVVLSPITYCIDYKRGIMVYFYLYIK